MVKICECEKGREGGEEKGEEREKEGCRRERREGGQSPRSTDPGYGHDKGSVLNARPYFQPLITRILHCIAIVNKY